MSVGDAVGVGVNVFVGVGVDVGFGVLVGLGVLVGFGVFVGFGVLVGLGGFAYATSTLIIENTTARSTKINSSFFMAAPSFYPVAYNVFCGRGVHATSN